MTGQNRSSAVMQQRRAGVAAPHALNYFPTPPWATRALCEFLQGQDFDLAALDCWEPACGEQHMVLPLLDYFGSVRATDVHPYPPAHPRLGGHGLMDFAMFGADEAPVDFVITNPPFQLAQAFIDTARAVAQVGFAMLVRSAFLEGADRYERLWSKCPPAFVLQFSERVVMLENRLVQAGKVDPFADKDGTKASTATAYVWLVWLADPCGDYDNPGGHFPRATRFHWIGPCRERLERPGDYPDYVTVLPPPEGGLFQ